MTTSPKSPVKASELVKLAQTVSLAGRPFIGDLEDRLGGDFFDRLDSTNSLLEQLVTGRTGPKETMKAKTRELNEVLAETTSYLAGVRSAIANQYKARHPMRGHFGIGISLNPTSMNSTLDALRMFIEGMEKYPTEAAAANLRPRDLAKLKGFLAEIPASNYSQETSKNHRKNATELLESTNYEVYKMLTWLKIAAELDLAHDPKARDAIVGPLTFSSKSKNKVKSTAAE